MIGMLIQIKGTGQITVTIYIHIMIEILIQIKGKGGITVTILYIYIMIGILI